MKKETVENIKKEFLAFKSKAGKPAFIACFGKTFVNEHEESYKISEEIAETIVEQGFGVIHGGYIGSMEAVSRGANVAIAKDQKKNQFWNIGVPMKTFDDDIKRSESMHLPSAEDILDRKRILVEMSDACVVLPVGGIGTLLEVLDVFHMYQIAEKFGGNIRPIIFYGNIWKTLMREINNNLDLKGQSDGSNFVSYIESIDELRGILASVVKIK